MSNDLTTLARDIANTRDMLAVNHPGAGSIWAEYCATIGGHAYTDARDCGESWAEANEIAMATELEWLARFGECYLATEPDAAEYAAKHSHTKCYHCGEYLNQADYAHNINSQGEERDSYETRCTNCLRHNPPCQIDAYYRGNLTTTAIDELLDQLKKAIKDDLKWRKEYKQKEKIRTERRYKKACAEREAQQAAKQTGEQQ
jgi:hypothetical protein